MKLSIITVNLNNRDGLQKTIDSVICQTFRDFEWIVIDGGSTDGSKELIEQYSDHFAYWVSEPDKGIYNAMNKGIKVAKGEYLQFLNSGDWLVDRNVLENIYTYLVNDDIIFGDVNLYKNNILIEERKYPDVIPFHDLIEYSICHCCSFIRKKLLAEDLYDEGLRIVSDWKFFLQKTLEKCTFKHINHTIVAYDMSGISSREEILLSSEREETIKSIIPPSILLDLRYIDQLHAQNQEWQIQSIRNFQKKGAFYHKMTTCFILLLNKIDTFSHLFSSHKTK